MLPAVRLYWFITLICAPLSLAALLLSTSGSVTWDSVSGYPLQLFLVIVFFAYAALGFYELNFARSNLRRNYPVLANLRYMLEVIRPEIQQYFIANNTEERPFSREQRNLVYRRAKGLNDTLPFGTEHDILSDGYHSIFHSIRAVHVPEEFARILIGGPQCRKPYNASRFNISGLSFGALSSTAIAALNRGAALGGFFHNTGEGSISKYHMAHGGDLVWQIGTGYFGCRTIDGQFDDAAFAMRASHHKVKMIEIKISQGAKPSHGGVLPGAKVTAEIARIRTVEVGKTVESPACHTQFSTPLELMAFITKLRNLCDGKPVGFKFCLGKKSEFLGIVKAMLETGVVPDFITVDGAEGGTGAAPVEFSNRLGTPCLEATYYVHQVLKGAGLREQIRIISAGKTATGFELLEKIAVGADAVNAARSMMLALGCIQSKSCNTNNCPTGIATQNPARARAVGLEDKSLRVYNFHRATVKVFLELCGAMGYSDPDQLHPGDIFIRVNGKLRTFDQQYVPLNEGQLLGDDIPDYYSTDWNKASAAAF
ncbi:MAG: FMN-binding glutamate synthase family protein [Pseudohongiellaceae bacterium]